jgi:site-specific DNA-methyltransferase (adenine-specific)
MAQVLHGDCLEVMKSLPDKSVQTIVFDPPYNIQKADWDTIPDYLEWLMACVAEFARVLKDNGSLFVFHNRMETIADLMVRMRATRFHFRQMLVWNKRFDGARNKGFLDGFVARTAAHRWETMCEYVAFFTFDNSWKLKQRRDQVGVTMKTIASEILSKTGGLTGWYSNIELGKNMPTHETIVPITKHLGLTLDDLVPKFRPQRTHHSVWNISSSRCADHQTPKPSELYEQLILHTTDEGDVVLDPTAGSFASVFTAERLGRRGIGIEKDDAFFAKAVEKIAVKR